MSTTFCTLAEDDMVASAMICQQGTQKASPGALPITKTTGADRTVLLIESKVLTSALHH